jgi:hypothetical protein
MPLSAVQETLDEGASSPKFVDDGHTFLRPPSPPPTPPTKRLVIQRMINLYEPKKKSSDVDMFLKVLKNKPKLAPAFGTKSSGVQVLKKVPTSSSAEKTVTRASF